MAVSRKDRIRSKRRTLRIRAHLKKAASPLPRLSVFRSLKNIYAQVIDDKEHNTVASCSSADLKDVSGDKKAIALAVGKELAKRAIEKGVTSVRFDRGSFLYHGRVKALAEGLREGGLTV